MKTITFLLLSLPLFSQTVVSTYTLTPLQVSVASYGAIGDNNPANAAVNVTAFRAAVATGKEVFIPCGTYIINDTITISIATRIIGASKTCAVINNTNNSVYAFQYLSALTGDRGENAGFALERLTLYSKYGLKINQSGNFATVFDLQAMILGIRIQDVKMQVLSGGASSDSSADTTTVPANSAELEAYGVGIRGAKLFNFILSGVNITGYGIGLYCDGCDISTVASSRFQDNSVHIWHYYHNIYGSQLAITDNDLLGNKRPGGITLENALFDTIRNNYFETPAASGTYIRSINDSGTLITENRFNNPGYSIPFISLAPLRHDIFTENRYDSGVTAATFEVLNTYWTISFPILLEYGQNDQSCPRPTYPQVKFTDKFNEFSYSAFNPGGTATGAVVLAWPWATSSVTGKYVIKSSSPSLYWYTPSVIYSGTNKIWALDITARNNGSSGSATVQWVESGGGTTTVFSGLLGFSATRSSETRRYTFSVPDTSQGVGYWNIIIDNSTLEVESITLTPISGADSSWYRYRVTKVANGTSGCANANGCWLVNWNPAQNASAATSQTVDLFSLPAGGYVEKVQAKTVTACSGASTITVVGLGTSGTADYFTGAVSYDLKAAVSNTNVLQTSTTSGSTTAAAVTIVASLASTGSNLDQVAAGCSFDVFVKWGMLP